MENVADGKVPFHSRLIQWERIEDRLIHRLEFGVVGIAKPAMVMIGSDFFRNPVIEKRLERGGLELPDHLVDQLAICVFKVLSGFVNDADGECGTWTAKDVTRWLRLKFQREDAERVIRGLHSQVTPGWEVTDVVHTGDDDVLLSDDERTRAAWPQQIDLSCYE